MTWCASWTRVAAAVAFCSLVAWSAISPISLRAQLRGVVVDQTGLPLPGAHIEIQRGTRTIASIETSLDGGFDLSLTEPADDVAVSLDGFETAHVRAEAAHRIVLQLARATATTEVVASALTSAGAAMEHLGSTMTAPLAQRLPTPRPRILQSLPLLPAVVRGRDGLLRIGGTRPHESSLWIDGFDVTDPVSGITAVDLPVESVRGMAVLREPVSAGFGNVLGSVASIETTPGGDQFKAGIQGFIPRPRLSSLGLGQIEAFFPRAYVSGHAGITRYFASTEFNFERVPVPGVTGASGRPNIGTTGVTSFARLDIQPSTRHSITVEGLFAPATTTASGLSTLRPASTVPDVDVLDAFGGVTDRLVLTPRDLLTVRLGVAFHHSALAATGDGAAVLTPEGWENNWFSKVDSSGTRESLSVGWERAGLSAFGSHSVAVDWAIYRRSMEATLVDQPIQIVDESGRLLRMIQFGPAGDLTPSETYQGVGVRDSWDITKRLQVDLGVRFDGGASSDTLVVGPRLAVRYSVDDAGRTTIRGSAGRYVGRAPLGAAAFGAFPSRTDTTFNAVTGAPEQMLMFRPASSLLPLPYADAIAVELEQRIGSTMELQAAVRQRRGHRLPTITVPVAGGLTPVEGVGESQYRELQLSFRKTFTDESQVFMSYVRASSTGDINDFGSLFTNLDAPLLEPRAQAPVSGDVPHRLRGWATFSLPMRVVLSPSVEWRTGFPYSALDVYQHYAGAPNSQRFPDYFSADVTAFKTFDLFGRKMDLGLQIFNFTGHFNPRDVISVTSSPRFQEYSSSFGVTFAGYMQVRW